jgi:hypothetical protein
VREAILDGEATVLGNATLLDRKQVLQSVLRKAPTTMRMWTIWRETVRVFSSRHAGWGWKALLPNEPTRPTAQAGRTAESSSNV